MTEITFLSHVWSEDIAKLCRNNFGACHHFMFTAMNIIYLNSRVTKIFSPFILIVFDAS